ncbi:MAG: tRNA pseudouridine(38-40) synthase TruA [Armatimonadetes bacterium]|nr:tRNA pseudouridine(38-40) synthase TruA [Armatimonadota bacterium]
MRNIKAVIDYDGTDFFGFQKQPKVRTVQGELEAALGELLNEPVRVIGAGRTDAGVHATGQVISFRAGGTIPIDRFRPALNGILPKDIRIKTVEQVSDEFHARYSAKARTYVYSILNREIPSALLERYTWQIIQPLDIEKMIAAAQKLIGIHDFASFGMPDKASGSTIRNLWECRIWRQKDLVLIKIKANAFLRGMARAIVGTLVEVGQEVLPVEGIVEILAARNRQAVRLTAPPQGLFLVKVDY